MRGTPGADVIDAGQGNDIIYALGGDDTVCGGNGADVVFAGPGDDIVLGGNDADLLVGEDGADRLSGGRAVDRVIGGGGADRLDGAEGDDVVAGGSGPDQVVGASGADRLVGGAGQDSAVGDAGSDACTAEVVTTCELAGPMAGSVTASLEVPATAPITGDLSVIVNADAARGVEMLIIEVNGTLVKHRLVASPVSVDEDFSIRGTDLPNGRVQVTAVAYDVDGNEVRSDAVIVAVQHQLDKEGATELAVLATPTRLSDLVGTLRLVDAPINEYRHQRQADEALSVPTGVLRDAATSGISVDAGGTTLTGGFSGRGLSLEDQYAMYRGLAEDGNPLVTSVRFDTTLTAAQKTRLGALVKDYVVVPARDEFESSGSAEEQTSASSAPRSLNGPIGKPTTIADAYSADPPAAEIWRGDGGRAYALAGPVVPDVDNDVFWPTFGQLDVEEHDVHVDRPFWFDTTQERVTFQHDLVWFPGVLDAYSDLDRAYEHDLKTSTDRSMVGKRPVCEFVNPFATWKDSFYAYREDGVVWETNVPASADPYFDTDLSDDCHEEDLSVGIRTPEILDDGLGDNHATHYWFRVDSARGDQDTGEFRYMSQRLTRLGGTACTIIGTSNCTGLDPGAGDGGIIVQTSGDLIPGVTLPTCLSWNWPANPDLTNNTRATRCGGDFDGDGWDDTIDCEPSDAGVNPGAVDIPNDGIDQNCDGTDLIVGDGTIRFTLTWDNANDEDLHVIEPDGTRIWYAATGPTGTGGRLDRDDNVGVCSSDTEPGGVENVYWPTENPAPVGTYVVEIRQYSGCGTPANWELRVYENNEFKTSFSGVGSGSVTYVHG